MVVIFLGALSPLQSVRPSGLCGGVFVPLLLRIWWSTFRRLSGAAVAQLSTMPNASLGDVLPAQVDSTMARLGGSRAEQPGLRGFRNSFHHLRRAHVSGAGTDARRGHPAGSQRSSLQRRLCGNCIAKRAAEQWFHGWRRSVPVCPGVHEPGVWRRSLEEEDELTHATCQADNSLQGEKAG